MQALLTEKGRCEANLRPFSPKPAAMGQLDTGVFGSQPAEHGQETCVDQSEEKKERLGVCLIFTERSGAVMSALKWM